MEKPQKFEIGNRGRPCEFTAQKYITTKPATNGNVSIGNMIFITIRKMQNQLN